jgi:hypothetical protein
MTTSKSCPSGRSLRLHLGHRYRSRLCTKAERAQYVSETSQVCTIRCCLSKSTLKCVLSFRTQKSAVSQARIERFKQKFAGEQSVDQVAKLAASVGAPVLTAASAVLAATAACGAFFTTSKLPIEGKAALTT